MKIKCARCEKEFKKNNGDGTCIPEKELVRNFTQFTRSFIESVEFNPRFGTVRSYAICLECAKDMRDHWVEVCDRMNDWLVSSLASDLDH